MATLARDVVFALRPPGLPRYGDTAAVIREMSPSEPVYLLCRARLRERATAFRLGFPGEVGYALEANPHPAVVATLQVAGIAAFEVASVPEIERVRRHAPGARVLFHHPVKAREEIHYAYHAAGVRSFAVDDEAELAKLASVVERPGEVDLSVRYRLADEARGEAEGALGADPAVATRLLAAGAVRGFIPGLAFHLDAWCPDPLRYARSIEAGARIAARAGVAVRRLCVGGGFPVAYPGAEAPGLTRFFEAIAEAVRRCFPAPRPRLVCAPGRSLVAPAVSLLVGVRHRRIDDVVCIDDGIYGGLRESLAPPAERPLRVWRGARPLAGDTRAFTVCGPTRDPADRLPRRVQLPASIAPGDRIEFGRAGAYASATASRFTGLRSQRHVEVEEAPWPV